MKHGRIRIGVRTLWSGVISWFACCSPLVFGVAHAEKPNVVFIAVDDLNDWAGYQGNRQVITPNLDKLAKQGVWFSQSYCQYPLCGPSRASVMSGLFFDDLDCAKLQPKDKDVKALSEGLGVPLLHTHFKNNGYKTMAVGKILHNHVPYGSVDMSGKRGPWNFNYEGARRLKKMNWQGERGMTDWGHYTGKEEEMSDYQAADWAVSRLEEDHPEPFLLMVGFLRPHVPWYVPKKYFDKYEQSEIKLPPYKMDDFDDIPAGGKEMVNDGYPRTEWMIKENQWRHCVQSYMACITFVDEQIGRVLDALEKSSHSENTIVVLWSDHGYHLGEKNTFQKHTLWERSAKAPLIIRTPEMNAGQRCDRVVGLIDIYPTLIDLCELPPIDRLRGRSLKPLLDKPEKPWDYPAFTYRFRGGKSLQFGSYRYIEYGDGSKELYDHASDPHEWTNLAMDPKHKDSIKSLDAMFPSKMSEK